MANGVTPGGRRLTADVTSLIERQPKTRAPLQRLHFESSQREPFHPRNLVSNYPLTCDYFPLLKAQTRIHTNPLALFSTPAWAWTTRPLTRVLSAAPRSSSGALPARSGLCGTLESLLSSRLRCTDVQITPSAFCPP